jgi:hypothetical protein
MNELNEIRRKLVAPKNRKNTFGGYNYRSCEDILEAVKPLLAEHNCTLTLSDEVVNIGEANYIKATATILNEKGVHLSAQGWAREEFTKKGMDAPQMTGTASSYARKYALNGLFCIDDTKDADTDEYRKENTSRKQVKVEAVEPAKPKRKPLTVESIREKEQTFREWLRKNCSSVNDVPIFVWGYYDCDEVTINYLQKIFND